MSELALRSKAHWGYSADFLAACRDELAVWESDVHDNSTFVVEVDGRVQGFFRLERLSDDSVELSHLFVEPGAVGTGLGRLLFEHARIEATRRGFLNMRIEGDPNAEKFYQAVGARTVGRRESSSIVGRFLPLLEIQLTEDA